VSRFARFVACAFACTHSHRHRAGTENITVVDQELGRALHLEVVFLQGSLRKDMRSLGRQLDTFVLVLDGVKIFALLILVIRPPSAH